MTRKIYLPVSTIALLALLATAVHARRLSQDDTSEIDPRELGLAPPVPVEFPVDLNGVSFAANSPATAAVPPTSDENGSAEAATPTSDENSSGEDYGTFAGGPAEATQDSKKEKHHHGKGGSAPVPAPEDKPGKKHHRKGTQDKISPPPPSDDSSTAPPTNGPADGPEHLGHGKKPKKTHHHKRDKSPVPPGIAPDEAPSTDSADESPPSFDEQPPAPLDDSFASLSPPDETPPAPELPSKDGSNSYWKDNHTPYWTGPERQTPQAPQTPQSMQSSPDHETPPTPDTPDTPDTPPTPDATDAPPSLANLEAPPVPDVPELPPANVETPPAPESPQTWMDMPPEMPIPETPPTPDEYAAGAPSDSSDSASPLGRGSDGSLHHKTSPPPPPHSPPPPPPQNGASSGGKSPATSPAGAHPNVPDWLGSSPQLRAKAPTDLPPFVDLEGAPFKSETDSVSPTTPTEYNDASGPESDDYAVMPPADDTFYSSEKAPSQSEADLAKGPSLDTIGPDGI